MKRPSGDVYVSRFGSLSAARELAGQHSTIGMTDEDYIAWAVKVCQANNGKFTTQQVRLLSAQDKGPSVATIVRRNGKFSNFKAIVMEAYAASVKEKEDKLKTIQKDLETNQLDPRLFEGAESEDNLIPLWAKYRVTEEVLPHIDTEAKIKISASSGNGNDFVRAVQLKDPSLHQADIEIAADHLGHLDDIWPLDEHIASLRLVIGGSETEELLAA
jgi:hypothetical protein